MFPLLTHNLKVVSIVTLCYSAFIASFYARAAFQFKRMLQEFEVLHRETTPTAQIGSGTFTKRLQMSLNFIRRTTVFGGLFVFVAALSNIWTPTHCLMQNPPSLPCVGSIVVPSLPHSQASFAYLLGTARLHWIGFKTASFKDIPQKNVLQNNPFFRKVG